MIFSARSVAGSVVVHAMGGWIALPAVLLLGARYGRYTKDGRLSAQWEHTLLVTAGGCEVLTARRGEPWRAG